MALSGLFLAGIAPTAMANSALDQYVEQVPDPRGDSAPEPIVKPKPPVTGADRTPVQRDNFSGSVANSPGSTEVDGETAIDATEPSSESTAKHKTSQHLGPSQRNSDKSGAIGQKGGRDTVAAQPLTRSVSGFNTPLVVFVGLVVIAMVVVAVRRGRSEQIQ